MAAAWQTVAARSEALGADLVITKPTGTVDGDLLVFVGVCGAGQTISKPDASWTTASFSLGGGAPCFYKIASSEPASWTFVVSGSVSAVGQVARVSGVNTSSPVDVGAGNFGTSGGLAIPSVSPSGSDNLLLQMVAKLSNTTMTGPAGVEQWDTTTPSQNVVYAGGSEVVGAGATGTRTWTPAAGTSPFVAYMLAINPTSVGATVVVPAPAASTAEAKVPAVTAGSEVAGVAVQATAAAQAPSVSAGATIVPPASTASASSPFGGLVVAGGATIYPPAASATADPGTPEVTSGSTVSAPRATAAAAAVAPQPSAGSVVAAVPATASAQASVGDGVVETTLFFDPPTQDQAMPDHFWGRFTIPVGVSVVKVGGTYTNVPTPTHDDLTGVEGADFFRGGYHYPVTTEVAADLTADGYGSNLTKEAHVH